MQIHKHLAACIDEHRVVLDTLLDAVGESFALLVQTAVTTIHQGGKIIFFGNGGSAADAQHLATELTVRFSQNRVPIAALALTTDTSALTAIGNDYDFQAIFSRQIEALCKKEDMVIGITTSGNSQNVINGLMAAKAKGAKIAVFTGGTGGKVGAMTPLSLIVPSTTTACIQEMHILIGQAFCGALEKALGLV
jgi:D-sedoheptulose 7-phosphate isomerase